MLFMKCQVGVAWRYQCTLDLLEDLMPTFFVTDDVSKSHSADFVCFTHTVAARVSTKVTALALFQMHAPLNDMIDETLGVDHGHPRSVPFDESVFVAGPTNTFTKLAFETFSKF